MVRIPPRIHADFRGFMEQDPSLEVTDVPAIETPRRGIAPAWHSVVLILVLLALGFSGTVRSQKAAAVGGHTAIYVGTIVYQWILVAYIAWGVRLRGRTLRDLIGGRWNSAEAVIVDLGIALATWFMILFSAAIIIVALKLQAPLTRSEQQLMHKIAPQSNAELAWFMALALTAGFCEEVIFRGYLQKQFKSWSNSSVIAVIGSTLLFGLGHLYQGWVLALAPTTLGLILALLAEWRKSLRPGIVLHTWQDSLSGIMQHFASRFIH
jgi:uncharacterized protein